MASRLLAAAFEARDPARLARFWADLLGREAEGALVPGDETRLGLRFVPGPADGTGPDRMHLHLTSDGAGSQEEVVATALGLGASRLDVGQRPDEGHVVLGDPEGNAFCVIEQGNAYLAGCGLLGELACDGSREAGLFWSAALGWPLVWDRDGETAIQSPRGGTKLAWSGSAPDGTGRRRFLHLVPVGDGDAEVERLDSLGATLLGEDGDGVVLADPDGAELRLARV